MLYSQKNLSVALLFTALSTALCFSADKKVERPELRVFELNHPQCQSRTLIETGREGFMTIANDLPGRKEYNELVRTLHRGEWSKLDALVEIFESVFEDSPLREAVAFLRVESLFDRITRDDANQIKEAEKSMREVLLLYPKSSLVPNIQATVGAFWLRNGQYTKSLAVFLKAKEDFPFHPLNCLFQFGVAENNFLLNENDTALKAFRMITQKCKNSRLITGAQIRLVELEGQHFSPSYGQKLARLYQAESNTINRFYPEVLYNLGEFKYQSKELSSAKFFFTEYVENKNKDPQCSPYASKRLADIAAKTKGPLADVVGLYLQTHDQFSKSDIGKYAYIQGMLLDYAKHSAAEQERRTSLIDEMITSMSDERLRHLAGLNKGLAVLESGQKGAVEYLQKVSKGATGELKTKEMAEFIASRVYSILLKDSKSAMALDLKKESLKDEELFEPIQEVYGSWIKGTSYELPTQRMYSELVIARFNEFLEKQKWSNAFELIENWKSSELWPGQLVSSKIGREMGMQITRKMMEAEPAQAELLFKALIENKEGMSAFLGQDFYPLFSMAYRNEKNDLEMSAWVKKSKGFRRVANTEKKIPADMVDFMNLGKAKALFDMKNYSESEALAKTIQTEKYSADAFELRIESIRSQRNYKQTLKLGLSVGTKIKDPAKIKRVLSSLVSDVNQGKLWEQSDALLKEAKKQNIQGKDLAPFVYLVGKTNSEQKICSKTISNYVEALKLDPENLSAQEAKFRLGKCYQKQKKKELAKKEWQEVVESKDPFWGPLAKSEISLMEGLK